MHYKFTLPKLHYAYDALEPYIDAATMQIHYEKHHQDYVTNLNKALEGHPELHQKSLEELLAHIKTLPEAIRTAIQNYGGGHANHSLFWLFMKRGGGGEPRGDIGSAISQQFGSFSAFQEKMNNTAKTRFGSGWAWLIMNQMGTLEVISTPNQDSPSMVGAQPLLGIDVWEHAYYLKYQNKRIDYVQAWWNTVDWSYVEDRYHSSR